MHRVAKDAGGVLVDLERRVGKLERSGRGFSIPPVDTTGGTIASDTPPPAPSDPDVLWIDTDDGNKIYRWNGSAWAPTMDPKVDLDRNLAATVLASWQDGAASGDGLVTLYRQSAAPGASGLAVGDLWVDSDTNGLWRWSGSAWGDLGDTELGELLARDALNSTVADGRVRTWWQFNEPVPQGFGDVWVNTSTAPSTLYRWNNYDWIQVLDWSVLDVQEQLETKISTWYEPAPPVSRAVGDLWYDTANQLHPYRAEAVGATTVAAGQWVSVQDGAIEDAASAASDALDTAADALTAAQIAQAMADGVITSHYSPEPPWPAGSEQDPSATGDLWLDTDTGQAYHWTGDDWLLVADNAVAAALLAAQDAQTTADGKISGYYLPDPPWANGDASHAGDAGDLWYDTDDQNKPHYWDGNSWETIRDEAIQDAQDTADQSLYSYVVEYSVSASETVAPTTGWSTATPTRTPGTYVWMRTTVTRNDGTSSTTSPALLTGNDGAQGDPGPQGVPGPTGANGQQLYTWIKYADTPTTGMADSPTGKAYLGLAYNKTTATESSTYSDYTWSLIKGADGSDGDPGVMGPPGPDGQPTYTWIKYGTSAAGAGLSDDPTGRAYIGIAYNKNTSVESETPADYIWSLIQGPPGANAATVTLTATTQVLAVPAAGGATTPATAVVTGTPVGTTIASWQYSVNGAAFSNTVPPGASRTGNVVTITGSTMTARTIAVKMADAAGVADTLTIAKIADGATGATGSQGIQGPTGADGQTLYTWLKYADSPTTGMSDSPAGKTYMGLAYNKTTSTESSAYGDYQWSLIQGPEGDQGVQGPAGSDGQPTYTWIKYGDSAAGAGLSDSPAGKTYIGIAYNKTTATESSTPGDYEWSLIQGPQGQAGADAYTVLLTNESHSFPGSVSAAVAGSTTTQVLAFEGAVQQAATIGTVTGQVTGLTTTVQNNGTATAQVTVTVTTSLTAQSGVLVIPVTVDGVVFTKRFSWTVTRTGATGSTGSQGIQGPAGPDGATLYTWLKYADTPTTGMSDLPAGKAYMGIAYNKASATESSTYSDYAWSLIEGPQGSQGIQGPAGADGSPTYTWIKYATNATGTAGFSDSPAGATYIGLAHNKTTATESSTPGDYQWSLIQGPEGPAGADAPAVSLIATAQALVSPAAGGATTPATSTVTGSALNTTITAWTYSVNGAAFSATVPPGVSRAGNVVTVTGSTMTASTIAVRMADAAGVADTLTVAKVLNGATGATGGTGGTGPTGPAGADAYTVILTNESHTFPGSTTAALAGSTVSQVLAFEGTAPQSATIGTITGQVAGLTTTIQNNGTATAQFTVAVTTSLTATSGVLTVPVTVDGIAFSKRFSWSVSRAGSTGGTGPAGPTGTSVTAITPFWAKLPEGSAAPAQPGSVLTPPAPWVAAEPAYSAGTEMWRTERVTYANPTSYSYTTPAKSSSYEAASAAMAVADTKNAVYRQTTRPWADGAGGHSGDVGDLWFDTSLGPGSAWEVVGRQLTSNVATVTTADPHDVQVGWTVSVIGVDPVFDGVHVVTAVGETTVSYALAGANVGFTAMEQGRGAVVEGQGVGAPVNKVFVWDGSVWNDTRDAEVTAITSTLNNQVSGQATEIDEAQDAITALQQQADDLALTAYAADGRINISDYEPLPEDAYQTGPEGEPIAKNEGSLWITRTRDRVNFITNPSFEVNTAGWSVGAATMTRTAKTGAPDSGYAARIVNNGTTSTHYVHGNPRYPVNPGQNVVLSGYAQLESGVGANYQAVAIFYDGAGVVVPSGSGGYVYGAQNQLAADGTWTRLFVSAPVPDTAATASLRFYSAGSNTADVWFLDAVLGEITDKLGRYFDGGSTGGSWTGAEEASASELDGGAVIRLFELADGGWVEKYWTADTISSVSADTIIGSSAYRRPEGLPEDTIDGALVADNSLAVDKMYAAYMTASEQLKAGDLVNTWDNNGLFMVQRASAGLRNGVLNGSFETDVAGYAANACTPTRSSTWAADGSYSMLLTPTGASTDSFVTLEGSYGGIGAGMRAGGTFTASGYVRLSGAQAAPEGRARRMVLYYRSATGTGGGLGSVQGEQAPNAAGEYRVALTFTLPEDTTEAFIRVYNGSATSTVWWDAIQVDESSTLLPYRGAAPLVREAHGFVLSDCAIGEPVRVYHSGYNELVANQAPGQQFLSVLPGGAASSAPQDVGSMVQQVGFSPNPGVLNFTAGDPITIT